MRSTAWALALATAFFMASAAAPPKTTLPTGAYRVTRMADLYDQSHAAYKPDDPRLVGRAVAISPSAATIEFGHGECGALAVRGGVHSPAAVLSRAKGAPSRTELHAAFAEIGLEIARPARTFMIRCVAQGGDAREGQAWDGAVLFAADRGRWGLVLGGELALVLDPSKPGVAGPSFPCASVTAASEQAICGDPDLAAWDRSVAQAFKRAQALADPATMGAEQKTWLVERDRCGAVKACLSKSLRERTDALMQQQ